MEVFYQKKEGKTMNFEQLEEVKKPSFLELDRGMSNTRSSSYFDEVYTNYVCIDYFKFRFSHFHNLDDLFIQGLLQKLFINRDRVTAEPGKATFKVYYTFDEDVYLFGGREKEKDEFGEYTYFFEMKGHALRLFELRCKENGVDYLKAYQDLFEFILSKFSVKNIVLKKIDLARDDLKNTITKEEYDYKFKKDFFVTRFKSKGIRDKTLEKERYSKDTGWSWTFGSRSGTHMMFYDKKMEREVKGNEVFVDSWIRVEARFREEYATVAFLELLNGLKNKKFMETICGLIYGLMDIKEDNRFRKDNMHKAPTWKKWDELLSYPAKIDIRKSQAEFEQTLLISKDDVLTMNKTIRWYYDSVYRAEALIYLVYLDTFDIFQAEVLEKACQNLNEKYLARVNYLRNKKGERLLNLKEAKDFLWNRIRYLKNISGVSEKGKEIFGDDLNVISQEERN